LRHRSPIALGTIKRSRRSLRDYAENSASVIPSAAAICAVKALVAAKTIDNPNNNMDHWSLRHFIEVAAHLDLIKSDTSKAARLAQDFRNLIHPGRAARLKQTCERGTAYSAIGAMEHVIRDLQAARRKALIDGDSCNPNLST
jgi:hypothetical protein